jgi:hypothetical protein
MPNRAYTHKIDWDAMEPDWRAGIKTKLQLSEEYGVSRAAIDKHWTQLGIHRDLTAKIKSTAQAKVTRATVTRGVTETTKITEREVIEAEAEIQSRIALAHRKDIPGKRQLISKLFNEIEGLTDNQDLIEQLTEALESGDQSAMATAAKRVASLPSRIKGTGELVTAYKTLITLEREIFGLQDSVPEGAVPKGFVITYRDGPGRDS